MEIRRQRTESLGAFETPNLGKAARTSGNTSKRYPPESRVRPVQMCHEIRQNDDADWAAMGRVAELVGASSLEAQHRWIRQDEIDYGKHPV